jgi:hypothetical protein
MCSRLSQNPRLHSREVLDIRNSKLHSCLNIGLDDYSLLVTALFVRAHVMFCSFHTMHLRDRQHEAKHDIIAITKQSSEQTVYSIACVKTPECAALIKSRKTSNYEGKKFCLSPGRAHRFESMGP